MLRLTILAVAAMIASPGFAQAPDFSSAKVMLKFEEFNLASNIVAHEGNLLTVDSQRDVFIIRDLASDDVFELPTSSKPQFTLPLDSRRVAVSDPGADTLAIYDVENISTMSTYKFRNSFGPWHMTYHNGIIYGSNRFDRLIVRYDVNRGVELPAWDAGSGPTHLEVRGETLFVLEQGAPGVADDHLGMVDLISGKTTRVRVPGVFNDFIFYGNYFCMALGELDVVRCLEEGTGQALTTQVDASPHLLVEGHGKLWALSRLSHDHQVISRLDIANGEAVVEEKWTVEGVRNARQFSFDGKSGNLLIRGNEKVISVPVN